MCRIALAAFIKSLLFHKPVKLLGGKGELRHTFVAATYVAVTFYPFFILADGIVLRVAGQALPASAYAGAQRVYLAALLGKIHEVSNGKAYVALGITRTLVLSVVLAVVLLLA